MKCKHCGKTIYTLAEYHSRSVCKKCRNEYMRDYQSTRRWLNGGPDNHLLGKEIGGRRYSRNGILYIETGGSYDERSNSF